MVKIVEQKTAQKIPNDLKNKGKRSELQEFEVLHHKRGLVIAIDGPAGTGKSSVTRRLAETLGFVHIDTGALYRAIAYLVSDKDTPLSELQVVELARTTHLEFRRNVALNPANRIFANGQDVTDLIRTPQVSMMASRISAYSGVRAALLGLQRKLGSTGKTILEGRDIGTVIFPDADIKFFLTANLEERAKRRMIELESSGMDTPSFEEVKQQICTRDQGDITRSIAPLKKASDAIELDTSHLTLDEVVQEMEAVVHQKLRSSQDEMGLVL